MSKIKIHSFLYDSGGLLMEGNYLGILKYPKIHYVEENTKVTVFIFQNTIQLTRETEEVTLHLLFEEGKKTKGSISIEQSTLPIGIETTKMTITKNLYDIEYSLQMEEENHPYHWKLEIEVLV